MSKKEQRKDDKETRRLTDLPLTGKQAEKTKAGAGTTGGGAGKVQLQDIHLTLKV